MDKKVVQKFQHSRVPFSRNTAVFRKELANRNKNSQVQQWVSGLEPQFSILPSQNSSPHQAKMNPVESTLVR